MHLVEADCFGFSSFAGCQNILKGLHKVVPVSNVVTTGDALADVALQLLCERDTVLIGCVIALVAVFRFFDLRLWKRFDLCAGAFRPVRDINFVEQVSQLV